MQGYWELKRKEKRVALRIPVRLLGLDELGMPFDEKCHTENVSRSGALVCSRHQHPLGSKIQFEAYGNFRSETTVRLILKDNHRPDLYKIGVEFNGPVQGWIVS